MNKNIVKRIAGFSCCILIAGAMAGCGKAKGSEITTNTELAQEPEQEQNIKSLKEASSDYLVVPSDLQIESEGYVDSEEKCYRIALERKEEVDGEYNHVQDYFFVRNDSDTFFIVDYASKADSMDADRYVFDACDFSAEYKDVTFDGNKDVVISLGHQGAAGTMVHCVYVYDNGEYSYVKSFENIPNYSVNEAEQCIEGEYDGKIMKFIYSDGEFVEQ
jgi:hypothetical protein